MTNVDADGNKESTSGKVRFDTDGKIGMDVSKETSDADGNKEKHSASVDYDHDAKKVGVRRATPGRRLGEDGLKTSTNTDVNVGFDADDGRLDVGTTHGRVVDDGQTKTESTDKVGVGLTEDTVAVNVGRTDRQTEKDGTSDGLSTNVGVDLGPDKSSVSAGFRKIRPLLIAMPISIRLAPAGTLELILPMIKQVSVQILGLKPKTMPPVKTVRNRHVNLSTKLE